ncbi:DUF45 domain-containing protein [Venatoribacter cucullus]|uniref:DUF45 domain-containing protein n=1 Tax=Venatoribacter cucullus TaxID=2661630 RepID=A0A9X7UWR0_9GAMM|nr:SprT family zinc-dependent metalloprotease [Venatoribacter cucullus]QQD24333.1 DUF45 domain-containing protein [Venatoribacter cucullus]
MAELRFGELTLVLQRKAIKNLHINVLPPDGKVRVSAPLQMTDTAIRMAVISRIPWIRKQQKSFTSQPRQTEREMVNGETHYLWGKRLRLDVRERAGKHEVKVTKTKITLFVQPGTHRDNRMALLNEYYRAQMKTATAQLLEYWQPLIGVQADSWGVKRMKTKWGSCNIKAARIWLNLDLARKAPECLEFILVHELVHLHERHHNERFMTLMDKYLPDWRERRNLLNSSPLAHDSWAY